MRPEFSEIACNDNPEGGRLRKCFIMVHESFFTAKRISEPGSEEEIPFLIYYQITRLSVDDNSENGIVRASFITGHEFFSLRKKISEPGAGVGNSFPNLLPDIKK